MTYRCPHCGVDMAMLTKLRYHRCVEMEELEEAEKKKKKDENPEVREDPQALNTTE